MDIRIWMKLIGCTFVIVGASGTGFAMAKGYGERLKMLEQLKQVIYLLKAQILYANAPLEEAFDTIGARTKGSLSQLLLQVSERIAGQEGESFQLIWQEEVENMDGNCALSEKDRQTLSTLGDHLGFLDREMQERNLLLYLEQLEQDILYLREHKQERSRLCTSLGVMGGLFLAILLY